MSSSEALGVQYEVDLRGGRLRYRDSGGDGPSVLLVHGVMVNADLWSHVVPRLTEAGLRCIAPDWPLGSHELPMPRADLTPPGAAAMIEEFMERLDLRDVTVVANDTGGALTQILMARRPERLGRVVLTPCDSFEAFFPTQFAYVPMSGWVPGAVWALVHVASWPIARRLPFGLGGLAKHGISAPMLESWMRAPRASRAVRRDASRFLRSVDNRHTLAAADSLSRFDRPVLLAWAWEDRVFPISLAHRLAAKLPRATVVGVGDSHTFMALDQPDRLAEVILEFLDAHRVIAAPGPSEGDSATDRATDPSRAASSHA